MPAGATELVAELADIGAAAADGVLGRARGAHDGGRARGVTARATAGAAAAGTTSRATASAASTAAGAATTPRATAATTCGAAAAGHAAGPATTDDPSCAAAPVPRPCGTRRGVTATGVAVAAGSAENGQKRDDRKSSERRRETVVGHVPAESNDRAAAGLRRVVGTRPTSPVTAVVPRSGF